MILSTSSSRAVSIRTGRSLCWRMRLHTSTPSRSGSIRSSTTSDGFSDSTSRSASLPLAVVRTVKPAFFRYAATNDAIDASSSTTSTVCGFVAMSGTLPARAEMEQVARDGGKRMPVAAVARIPAVRHARVGLTLEDDGPAADREDVHPGAVDPDLVRAVRGAETKVAADEARLVVRERRARQARRVVRDARADVPWGIVEVLDDDPVELVRRAGRDVAERGPADNHQGDDGDRSRRARVLDDEGAVGRLHVGEGERRGRRQERDQRQAEDGEAPHLDQSIPGCDFPPLCGP